MSLRRLLFFETRFQSWQTALLTPNSYSAHPRSFWFHLLLYSMCCWVLEDQHSGYLVHTRQPEQCWSQIIGIIKTGSTNLTSTQQKEFWGTTPYISSLYNAYMKQLYIYAEFPKKKKQPCIWKFHIGIQSTLAYQIGDFTSPMVGQQLCVSSYFKTVWLVWRDIEPKFIWFWCPTYW